MITDLKPYPSYRDTGSKWLGQVPSGWGVRRQSNLVELRVSNVDKHQVDGERPIRLCNYVEVYRCDRIRADIPFSGGTATDGEIERFRLRRGDVLITKDSETPDDIASPALVEHEADDLVCGYHLAILRPRPEMSGAYLFRASQSVPVASQYQVSANGVTRFGLTHGDIRRVEVPVPPLEDQTAIARFLDHVDSRIQRIIAAQEQLVSLLEEEKSAVIDRLISRGLDHEVPLRPTGFNGFRELPEHWQIGPLRRFCSVVDCKHLTVPPDESGFPVASVREVRGFDLDLSSAKCVSEASYLDLLEGGRRPSRGDLVYCRNVNVGACAYVDIDVDFALGQDVCLLRPRQENGRFINYVMHSTGMSRQLSERLIGSTFNRVNISEIKTFALPIPPRAEQDAIVRRLDKSLRRFHRLSIRAGRQATLLREYRTRLFSDVVTGRLDVREAAARLPDDRESDDPALDERLEEVAAG